MSRLVQAWRALLGKPEPAPTRSEPKPTQRRRGMSARYDLADDGAENRNHWLSADTLGPKSANSPDVRQKLRSRARYECDNNGYAGALVEGRANDTIGTGPRLQLSLPEQWEDPDFGTSMTITPPDAARLVELRFLEWAEAIDLTEKLYLFDESQTRDGELFGVEINNPALPDDGVQLDLQLYESEQCHTPDIDLMNPNAVDGIVFDNVGNPVAYHFLKEHPGEQTGWGVYLQEYDVVPAENVYHFFRKRRAGQARGIPDITAALPLYGIQRRMTLATLLRAETAANVAGVIESDLPSPDPTTDGTQPPDVLEFDEIPFSRNALLTLAAGQKAKAFDPLQSAPDYREFKGEVHTECGQTVGMPGVLATGDYSQVNYSSGRLARTRYQGGIQIRRERIRRIILDRLFRRWLSEARKLPDYLPAGLPPVSLWVVRWQWPGFPSIDPVKDATANEIALRTGQTTLERVCAENGDDWDEVLQQQAREMKKRADLGLPVAESLGTVTTIDNEDGTTTTIGAPDSNGNGSDRNGATGKAAAGQDVQATALNGAQIASLVLICDKLSLDQYPAAGAEDMIRAAFPLMDRQLIHSFVTSIDKHDRPKLEPAEEEEPANA